MRWELHDDLLSGTQLTLAVGLSPQPFMLLRRRRRGMPVLEDDQLVVPLSDAQLGELADAVIMGRDWHLRATPSVIISHHGVRSSEEDDLGPSLRMSGEGRTITYFYAPDDEGIWLEIEAALAALWVDEVPV